MKEIRRLKSLTNLIIISTLLIVLVIFMMLTQPEFFQEPTEKNDLSLYSEQINGWHRIELGAFSIATPKNFKYIEQQGIDSYVGLITDREDSIHFDYGWYSNDFGSYLKSYDTINGAPASVAIKDGDIIGAHFPKIKNDNSLSVFLPYLDRELASQIIASIKFPSISGRTTEVIGANYSQSANLGQALFRTNCIHCHKLDEIRIGPPLRGVIQRTSKAWFTNWVLNPDELIKSNEKAAELFREYSQVNHPAYELTEKQLEDLIEFIEREQ